MKKLKAASKKMKARRKLSAAYIEIIMTRLKTHNLGKRKRIG